MTTEVFFRRACVARRFRLHALSLALVVGGAALAQDTPLSKLAKLSDDDRTWDKVPEELSQRAVPVGEVELKVGKTKQGAEYLEIEAEDDHTHFMIAPNGPEKPSYLVEAEKAFYWPDLHLLSLEDEVVVTSPGCRLEGKTLDILLLHDTVRLTKPKAVKVSDTELPIETESVRVSGLASGKLPVFKWDVDGAPDKEAASEMSAEAPPASDSPTQAASAPLPPESTPTVSDSKSHAIQLTGGSKLALDGEPIEIGKLKSAVKEILAKDPKAVFSIHQAPSVSSSLLKKVHQTLNEFGFEKVNTVMEKQQTVTRNLDKEVQPAVEADESAPPTGKGGHLLWAQGPGKYLLNGKSYSEASLRQTLRSLARVSPEAPIVVAGPRGAPANVLKDLVADIRGYGFEDVRLAFPLAGS
ncbi:MAG: hypothetical protein GHCLOJNM_02403 [bacterium]|nr:hypothetical protein [bacterium]